MNDPAQRHPPDRFERTAVLGPARSQELLAPSALADALVTNDTAGAWSALRAALAAGASYTDVATDVVGPALVEVGARWAARRITVAQEHLATANATTLLGRAFLEADVAAPNGRTAVFACVAGNHHALGVRILSDAFALAGWDVRSLGANVPTDDLIAFVRGEAPDVVGLSLSHADQAATARAVATEVRAPGGGPTPFVVVGGFPFVSGALTAADVGADAAHTDARSALDALG
jgi:methanogenic corrinoid protein MtbC1